MDLQHFIVRAEVLSLLRKALRVASRAPVETSREVRRYQKPYLYIYPKTLVPKPQPLTLNP